MRATEKASLSSLLCSFLFCASTNRLALTIYLKGYVRNKSALSKEKDGTGEMTQRKAVDW